MLVLTFDSLSKTRKKRPTPANWLTSAQLASFSQKASTPLMISNPATLVVEGDYASAAGSQGDAAIYSIDADTLERQLTVGEAITSSAWLDTKLVFATAKGSVKVWVSGSETASFTEHAGPATGICIHPSGEILASVGADKGVVVYDLTSSRRVGRCYSDSGKSGCCMAYLSRRIASANTFSLHNVRLPSRRPHSRSRHSVWRHQALHDKHTRGCS